MLGEEIKTLIANDVNKLKSALGKHGRQDQFVLIVEELKKVEFDAYKVAQYSIPKDFKLYGMHDISDPVLNLCRMLGCVSLELKPYFEMINLQDEINDSCRIEDGYNDIDDNWEVPGIIISREVHSLFDEIIKPLIGEGSSSLDGI